MLTGWWQRHNWEWRMNQWASSETRVFAANDFLQVLIKPCPSISCHLILLSSDLWARLPQHTMSVVLLANNNLVDQQTLLSVSHFLLMKRERCKKYLIVFAFWVCIHSPKIYILKKSGLTLKLLHILRENGSWHLRSCMMMWLLWHQKGICLCRHVRLSHICPADGNCLKLFKNSSILAIVPIAGLFLKRSECNVEPPAIPFYACLLKCQSQ